jgi:hypothetical protein
MVDLFERGTDVAEVVAQRRTRRPLPLAVDEVRIGVGVEVHHRVRPEVDRVRACDPRPVELLGIEHLHRHRFPSTGGTAVGKAGIALPDSAKPLLDFGDQLVHDRVAVGPWLAELTAYESS